LKYIDPNFIFIVLNFKQKEPSSKDMLKLVILGIFFGNAFARKLILT